MAGVPQDDDDLITGINVTPLVDITLVLLIIFMVTTTYIVSPSIKVDLPKAATAEETAPSTVSVIVSKSGTYYLNGLETTEAKLTAEVQRRLAEKDDLQVIVAADAEARHGQVSHLVDLVKGVGVTKFAINTQPVPAPVAPLPPADEPVAPSPGAPGEVSPAAP